MIIIDGIDIHINGVYIYRYINNTAAINIHDIHTLLLFTHNHYSTHDFIIHILYYDIHVHVGTCIIT